jgi:S-DNA-T family DNA segregation ATPase FtsK/SpoIIIE
MAIKINANMSDENKKMLVDWIPRLVRCFSSFNCDLDVQEAYVGRTFVQFHVEDRNKTRFNEFMMEKLTDVINTEFNIKDTDITTDSDIRDFALVIQIPLQKRETVSFSYMTSTKEFVDGPRYTFTVGESVKNRVMCCDLTQERKILVGGMANAGKTVFLNAMICSLLLKNNADTLKIALFDKRQVFKCFAEIPHLLFHGSVFDDYGAKEAYNFLKSEIEWRKVLFERNGCRNLEEYNRYAEVAKEDSFPALFLVIDELADWTEGDNLKMLVELLSVKNAAELGVFIVVSTQKPSIEYLGAALKEEFPTRISFKFDNPLMSRIMLNKTSATKLQGDGDMYYRNTLTRRFERLQAPNVTREDILDTLVKFNIRPECEDNL